MKTFFLLFLLSMSSCVFSEIKVNYKKNVVEIYWLKKENEPVKKFIIERSSNGKYFEAIINIDDAKPFIPYYEIDFNPPNKIAYYRVKQVSEQGSFKYSETIMVKNYSKLNYYTKNDKSLKKYKGKDVLLILKNKKGIEYYLKADVTEYKRQLYVMSKEVSLKSETYTIIATSDDRLINKQIIFIANENPNDFLLTQSKK